MQEPARLILVDQGLIDFAGHHLGYSSSLAQAAAARGIPALVLANRAFPAHLAGGSVQCLPTFEALYQTSVRRSPMRGVLYSLSSHLPANMATPLTRALRRARHSLRAQLPLRDSLGPELVTALDSLGGAQKDLVLMHSVSAANVQSVAAALTPAAVGALGIVLRRTPEDMDTADGASASVVSALRDLSEQLGQKLLLYADTAGLAARFANELALPVTTVPIPIVMPPTTENPPRRLPHLVFAGGARTEKGYHLLLPLVEQLQGRARFTIHSGPLGPATDPMVRSVHRGLRRLSGSDVVLIDTGLTPQEYVGLLMAADLLVLPYDGKAYALRSSNILAEARAIGLPAIVPHHDWMEESAGPFPEVVFHGPADFIPAVERTLRILPAVAATLRASASEWRMTHSPEALLAALLSRFRGPTTAVAAPRLVSA